MSKLTLGPVLYHWDGEKKRDFYFRIADEAPIDRVYVGEVVCSKRESFFAPYLDAVVERLKKAGKEVVLSTLSLVTSEREMQMVRSFCDAGYMVEANDVSCVRLLAGKPFVIGPSINVFNEGTLDFLRSQGATRLVMSMELTAQAMGLLAAHSPKIETEVMVFGRQPLTVSMRCYSARAYGRHKDGCQFVCGKDPDGLPADTITGQKLLAINGTQTQSHGYVLLADAVAGLQKKGVGSFRLSPQGVDMVAVAELFRSLLDRKTSPEKLQQDLRKLTPVPFINGYARGVEGMAWVDAAMGE